ncbi:MAG: hypothetical protein ACI4EO_01855 [Blautia sp.]
MATREEMKVEALDRMKTLSIQENAIREFKNEDKLNKSEKGILFWISDEEEKMVRDWEKSTGNIVYHAIYNVFEFGRCLSLLYVSEYDEEWEYDREDMKEGIAIAHCLNLDNPQCSESGSIGVRPCFGGVARIW